MENQSITEPKSALIWFLLSLEAAQMLKCVLLADVLGRDPVHLVGAAAVHGAIEPKLN